MRIFVCFGLTKLLSLFKLDRDEPHGRDFEKNAKTRDMCVMGCDGLFGVTLTTWVRTCTWLDVCKREQSSGSVL